MKKIKTMMIIFLMLVLSSFVIADAGYGDLVYVYTMDDADVGGATLTEHISGNDGTITGATSTGGVLGEARAFDGNDNIISDTNSFLNGDIDKTWCMWIKSNTNNAEENIIYMGGTIFVFTTDNNKVYQGGFYNTEILGGDFSHVCWVNHAGNDTRNLYVNGTFDGVLSGAIADADTDIIIGMRSDSNKFFNGVIDNIMIWNGSRTTTQIIDDFNSGAGRDYTYYAPSVSSIDLLTANQTAPTTYKNLFNEGENFNVYVNWTENGIGINSTDGKCNISLTDGLYEDKSVNNNFTLCDSGCDYISYSEIFDLHDTVNAVKDTARFDICHEQINQGDVIINFSCTGGFYQETIPAISIPLCSLNGIAMSINTSVCIGQNDLNVTIGYNGINQKRKQVSDLELDREFSLHNNYFNDGETYYNYTLDLWITSHSHEYYIHGKKNISASCSHNSISDLDNELDDTITIVNSPPIILFENVEIDGDFFDLLNNSVYEYNRLIWGWNGLILDDDLVGFNVTFYNNTGHPIFNISNQINATQILLNTTDYFREFSNPYKLEVLAWDDNTTIEEHIFFNITDTATPLCTGFIDDSVLNNTVYSWDVECTDESFFSLNVSCNNGFSSFIEGLDEVLYPFTNSTLIVADTICQIEYCDGHTDKDIKIDYYSTKQSAIFDGKVTITAYPELDAFTLIEKNNKIEFEIEPTHIPEYINFTITSDEYIHIMDTYKHTAWMITGDYWIDFESDDISFSKIFRIDDNTVGVDILVKDGVKKIKFKSIGKLNCVDQSINIISTIPDSNLPLGNEETREFTSLEQGLFWMFLTLLWFMCMIASLLIKGQRGKNMGILLILQMIIGLVVGIGWFSRFNILVGVIIMMTAVGIFLGKAMEQ